jgi:hypothetical protein
LKRSILGKNRVNRRWGPTGPAGPPYFGVRSGPVSRVPPFFRFLSPWEKVGPVNLH